VRKAPRTLRSPDHRDLALPARSSGPRSAVTTIWPPRSTAPSRPTRPAA